MSRNLLGHLHLYRHGERKGCHMRRLIQVTAILSLIIAPLAAFGQSIFQHQDTVVVDRSTRSKAVNDYTYLTRDAIQQAWTTPLDLSVKGSVKGKVGVNYVINRNGQLDIVNLSKSSGNPELDNSLIEAIRNAAPFPPFPDDLRAGSVMIKANFVVADIPSIPVTTVDHAVEDSSGKQSVQSEQTTSDKKYLWGIPAGTSENPEVVTEGKSVPPAPPIKKYHWGASK
jgi:TonB family protein